MIYNINHYKNRWDKKVVGSTPLTWEQLVTLFSKHTVCPTKDGEMFNLCTFDTAHCDAESVNSYNCLVLDYDGEGATIENIITRFIDYTHLGYTSYRHAITGVEKFRVILPFSTECPINDWYIRKDAFLAFAGPSIDTSCTARSRTFYMPSCHMDNIQLTDAWNNAGTLLEWESFTATPAPVYVGNTAPILVPASIITDMLNELARHISVLDYTARFEVTRAVQRHLGDTAAISEMRSRWSDATYNGKYEDIIKSKSSNKPGIPALLTRIRKYNAAYKTPGNKTTYSKTSNKLTGSY